MVWSGPSLPSSRKADGFSPTLALAAAMAWLGGCGWAAQDSCLDDGGVWDADTQKCFCSYSQEGAYDEEPSTEHIQWRQWCADKTDLDSIRNADTSAPAQ